MSPAAIAALADKFIFRAGNANSALAHHADG